MEVSELGGRKIVSTGTKWEPVVGYSRAVRAGNWIAVTGTIGTNPDGSYPQGPSAQMRRSLEIVIAAIEALGGRREDIIRTRIYVTDISAWREVGAVHAEFFGNVLPATTMVEVSRLADPEALLEVEADAVVGN